MKFSVSVSSYFNCTLERAFKTPLLCDVSKIHTGFGLMPKVTHVEDDEDWGKIGSTKKIFVAKSLTQNGGFASVDSILERVENDYWRFQVSDFQAWMLGFYKFVGFWKVTEITENNIRIDYSYELHTRTVWLAPINWLFAQLFWRKYVKHAIENVRRLAYNEEPYQHK